MRAVLWWFLRSWRRDTVTGTPDAAPEWPVPGGLADQDPRVVEAYDVLREETRWVHNAPKEAAAPQESEPRRATRASARRR